ncbi:MAG: hypothetical protein Q9195_008297 [Heterodermia aff. obscurata]
MAVEPSTPSSFPNIENADTHDEFPDLRMPTLSGYSYSDSESSDDGADTVPTAQDDLPAQQPITYVQDAVEAARQKLALELDCMDQNLWNGISLDDLLSHIAAERLARMPHCGSPWDRTLRDAESFAVHISQFRNFVDVFLPESSIAAEMIWANSRVLLELGSNQTPALEKAFGILYVLSLDLTTFHRFKDILGANIDAQRELGQAYADILSLVVDITISHQRSMIGVYRLTARRHKLISRIDDPNVLLAAAPDHSFQPVAIAFSERRQRLVQVVWDNQLQVPTIDRQVIQAWLTPQAYHAPNIGFDSFSPDRLYPGLSCEWFQKHLTNFLRSKDQALEVTGKPGCGKTSLFLWSVDFLKRRVLGRTYTTIAFSIDPAVEIENASIQVVQRLLLQILDQGVGNLELMRRLSTAYDDVSAAKDSHEAELTLWQAFKGAVQGFGVSTNLVIIVDGLDAVAGGEPKAVEVLDYLYDSVAESPNTKLLVFARPFSQASKRPSAHLSITPDHTFDSLSRLLEKDLLPNAVYKDQQDDQRAAIVERIARSANGSFVWADIVVGLILRENNLDGLLKTLERMPKSITQILPRVLSSLDTDANGTKYVLSWLMVALRPLSLHEVQLLIGSNSRKPNVASTVASTADDVVVSSANLLVLRQDIIRYRHNVVKEALLEMSAQGRGLMLPKDANCDPTLRLLKVARIESATYDIPMMNVSSFDPTELLGSQSILAYTAQYWLVHFCRSSMYNPDQDFIVPSAIKKNFPDTALLPALEGKFWKSTDLTPDTLDMTQMALQIRCEAVGSQSLPVLQTRINLAMQLESSSDFAQASLHWYEAAKVSQKFLGLSSDVTSGCASHYMDCVGRIQKVSSARRLGYQEEMLRLLVETSRHQCGGKSDHVIKYQQALGEFFINTQDVTSAIEAFDELHDLVIERYGPDSTEARTVNAKLAAALQSDNMRGGDTMLIAKKLFTLSQQTMDESDPRRVAATIHLAEAHQTREDYTSAEILLVELWKTITDATLAQPSTANQQLRFTVAMAYVNFLQHCARDTEATGMLLGLWAELEQSESLSEVDMDHLRLLQGKLSSSGNLTVSLSALLTMWKWYTNSGPQYTNDATSVASSISDNVKAIQDQHRRLGEKTTSGEHQSEGQSADANLQEIFDIGVLNSQDFPVDESFISNSDRTSAMFVHQERANRTTESVPPEFQDQVLGLVDRLIFCLNHEKRLGDVLQTYLSLYEASKKTSGPSLKSQLNQPLIGYYKAQGKVDSLVDVYDEILQNYRSELGPAHPNTIRTLYMLSSLCDSINRQESMIDYNQQILAALNGDAAECHPDAIEAALKLSEVYSELGLWKSAVDVGRILWQTVLEDHFQEGLASDTIPIIYGRYRRALTQNAEGDDSTLRPIAEQYYYLCLKLYNPESDLTMKAAFELAEMYEREQPYQVQAVRAYQQIVETASSSNAPEDPEMVTSMMTAESRLAVLYRRMSLNMSIYLPEVIGDAIEFFTDRYEEAKAKSGYSDDSTLDSLAELIHLYALKDSGSDQTAASNLLQSVAAEIISYESSPLRLMKSAARLATIYSNEGYSQQGIHLVDTLRRQFFLEDTLEDDGSMGILHRSLDPKCYIFIVTLESGLATSEKQGFSQTMPDLLYENMCYKMCVGSEDLKEKLDWGLRLHEILRNNKRVREIDSLEKILFKALFGVSASSAQTKKPAMWTMLTRTLGQLGRDTESSVGEAVCAASNDLCKEMIEDSEFDEAYEIAHLTFDLGKSLKTFADPRTFAPSLRLSLRLANNDVLEKIPSEELRTRMSGLLSAFLREVLGACEDFMQSIGEMDLNELKEVIGLLSQQEAYPELEKLISVLWSSHATQKSWTHEDIVWFGRRYVEVQFTRGNKDAAIEQCEAIVYNLTTLWGTLDPTTVEMSLVLSRFYAATGRAYDAVSVHGGEGDRYGLRGRRV